MLYDMTNGALVEVAGTSFEAEHVLERSHLQAALRAKMSVIDPDLLVVSEEFGWFEGANRWIDLLCVDRSARLVVVELKRTTDGGHMELQALRYAAMVSTMTFSDLVDTYRRSLRSEGDEATDPEQRLREWMSDVDDDLDEDPVLERDVRVILVAAGFDKEITTTVLWLNDVFGLDIRCVRLTPYKYGDKLLLDVQHLVPLPEAAELTVQLKRRGQAVKASTRTGDSRDWTPYVVVTPDGSTEPLRKRHAVRTMVEALHELGVRAEQMAGALPSSKFLRIDDVLEDEELEAALGAEYGKTPAVLRKRYFLADPIHEDGSTWVLSNQWGGARADRAFASLAALDPDGRVRVVPAVDGE